MGVKDPGILTQITRAFLFQGALIALAAILGVFFAKIVIEEILIRNAILEEADYFWTHYQQDPDFNLPDTKNLTGYFDPGQLPELVRGDLPSEPGFYEYHNGGDPLVLYLTREHDRLLYLLYYRGQVDRLVLYYGLAPLLTVLLIVYLSLWLSYRLSQRTVSPVVRLARQINQLDFRQPELTIDIDQSLVGSNDEIQILADAIHRLGQRLDAFIARERDFTRDASHELRSPLTVINIAADMLESEQELSRPARNSVARIQRAIADMQRLTEVFLMLAREDNKALTRDMVDLYDVLQEEVERARLLNRKPAIDIRFRANNHLRLSSSDMVLSVLFGNLIRNSLLYTDEGSITVFLSGHDVFIEDSGQGMTREQVGNMFRPYQRGENVNASGYGIGMTIVKRLTDRFHWPIAVQSEVGKGTRVRVSFPDARIE